MCYFQNQNSANVKDVFNVTFGFCNFFSKEIISAHLFRFNLTASEFLDESYCIEGV